MSIDWFRTVTDLERIYTLQQIGRAVGRDAATIHRYKQGAEPRYSVGVAILQLHAKLIPTSPPLSLSTT